MEMIELIDMFNLERRLEKIINIGMESPPDG
jgi:hypothetical protein